MAYVGRAAILVARVGHAHQLTRAEDGTESASSSSDSPAQAFGMELRVRVLTNRRIPDPF